MALLGARETSTSGRSSWTGRCATQDRRPTRPCTRIREGGNASRCSCCLAGPQPLHGDLPLCGRCGASPLFPRLAAEQPGLRARLLPPANAHQQRTASSALPRCARHRWWPLFNLPLAFLMGIHKHAQCVQPCPAHLLRIGARGWDSSRASTFLSVDDDSARVGAGVVCAPLMRGVGHARHRQHDDHLPPSARPAKARGEPRVLAP